MGRRCDDCKRHMGAYEPRRRVGDRMLCPACVAAPRGGMVSATASADHEVLYHITDRHRFALDPHFEPEDNALSISSRAGNKGIYLTDDPDHWRANGYHRPYVAEIHVPKGLAREERWGHEKFLPAEHFDKATVHRVMPFDEHQREKWKNDPYVKGTIEEGLGYPPSTPPGKDVRDFTPEEHTEHLRRFRDYAHDVQRWGWNEFNDKHEHVGVGDDDLDHEGMPIRRDRQGNPMTGGRYAKKEHPMTTAARRVVAHDSGDGMTVFHCPFCGSGQVLARSDRTIECQYCHTTFTVQVQPVFANFPQTIDGQPMQVPGMPGQAADPGMGGDPMDPGALDADGMPPQPGEAMDGSNDPEEAEAPEQPDDPQDGESDDANPFAKGSMLTAKGAVLPREEYINHVALQYAPDKARTAAQIRARRG